MTSQLCHHYVVRFIDTTFYIFFSHTDYEDDSCQKYEKLSKFIKVTAKLPSVPFFGHGVLLTLTLTLTHDLCDPLNN